MIEQETDDRSAIIHWAESALSKNNLFFVFTHGTKVAECWNRPTADVLVKALRLLDETEMRAQRAPWQPIDTIPQDRPIDGWHKDWKCPVTISYRSWGNWIEKTLTTEWPIEAFTHWRETSEAPDGGEK